MTQNVPLIRGRSCQDLHDSLAYSLYLINEGRIGSRAEREYLAGDRARRQYEQMSSQIKTYKYEDDENEDEIEHDLSSTTFTPQRDIENNYLESAKINDSFDGFDNSANSVKESLLDSNRLMEIDDTRSLTPATPAEYSNRSPLTDDFTNQSMSSSSNSRKSV